MKFQVYVVTDSKCFGDGSDQLIATFENVDEYFMDELVLFIPEIRDVKCRWQEAPQNTTENAGEQQPRRCHVPQCKNAGVVHICDVHWTDLPQ